jgi:hypothetical protein
MSFVRCSISLARGLNLTAQHPVKKDKVSQGESDAKHPPAKSDAHGMGPSLL